MKIKHYAIIFMSALCLSTFITGCGNSKIDLAEETTEMNTSAETTNISSEQANSEETTYAEQNVSVASETGISPDFKAAMDAYEQFFDGYVEFMKKYKASNGTDMSLLSEYTEYMSEYSEKMAELDAMDEGEMTTEEAQYFTEVYARITSKLLEAAS